MPLPISSLFSFYKKLLGALDFLLSFFLILIIIGHLDIMELYYFYFWTGVGDDLAQYSIGNKPGLFFQHLCGGGRVVAGKMSF